MPHIYNTRLNSGVMKRKKYIIDDDNSSDNNSDNESDTSKNETTNNKNLNKLEYYTFLNSLYPSKYMNNKIHILKKQKLIENNNFDFETFDISDNNNNENKIKSRFKVYKQKKSKKNKNIIRRNKKSIDLTNCPSESETDDEINEKYKTKDGYSKKDGFVVSDDEEDEENKDFENNTSSKSDAFRKLILKSLKNNKNNNLIIIGKNVNNNKYYDEEDDSDDEEDENDSDNEKDENYDSDHYDNEDDDEDDLKSKRKQAAEILFDIIKSKYDKIIEEEGEDNDEDKDLEKKITTKKTSNKKLNDDVLDDFDNKLDGCNNNLGENKIIEDKEDIIPAPKNISNKNYKKFDKIMDDEDKESEYFKKCLSNKSQTEAIEKLQKIKDLTKIDKPYLLHLVDLDIPDEYKACALRKINTMRAMGGGFGNSEYYKIKSWVDAFLKIPFNKYNNLPISFADGIEKCHDFMEDAKKTLDSVAYGLEDAKIQIMQMIGLWLVNPNAVGSAIAIKGPPGTGKTTLIKEGISKILNRPFALIALGGCGDSGFLDGFEYTYEGSKYGKIIDILIQCGCMNPIILFDELDKLSDSFKGQEITGVLTHLTDSTQNSKFTDKYLSEISLDMSKALYIFSYNDEKYVNPILKDRMYKIETKGYKTKDKLVIAKDYLLPKIREEIKFSIDDVVFNNDILEYIINNFTEKEDGVRNLKRCLEIIYKKLNLYRLMKPDINLFEKCESSGMNIKDKISFPCTLKKDLIDKLINKNGNNDLPPFGMYN